MFYYFDSWDSAKFYIIGPLIFDTCHNLLSEFGKINHSTLTCFYLALSNVLIRLGLNKDIHSVTVFLIGFFILLGSTNKSWIEIKVLPHWILSVVLGDFNVKSI